MTVCKKGFIPRGRRRITCLEDEENKGSFKWDFKQLTACITCDPVLPQFDDDRIIRKCKINKKVGDQKQIENQIFVRNLNKTPVTDWFATM